MPIRVSHAAWQDGMTYVGERQPATSNQQPCLHTPTHPQTHTPRLSNGPCVSAGWWCFRCAQARETLDNPSSLRHEALQLISVHKHASWLVRSWMLSVYMILHGHHVQIAFTRPLGSAPCSVGHAPKISRCLLEAPPWQSPISGGCDSCNFPELNTWNSEAPPIQSNPIQPDPMSRHLAGAGLDLSGN